MFHAEKVLHSLYAAVDEVNEQLPGQQQVEKSTTAILFGKTGKLDSLGLVNLILAVEEQIEQDFGVAITIADERAMSQKHSPFRTIGALQEYIGELLQEVVHDN